MSSEKTPKLFYLIVGLTLIFYLAWSLIDPILPLYIVSLGASKSQLGVLIALPAMVTIITRMPLRVISRKLGGWFLVPFSFVVQIISFMLYYVIFSPFWLYPVTILYALAWSSFLPVSVNISSELASVRSRGESLGKYFTAVGAGMLFGPLLCSLLVVYFDLRLVFLLTIIFPFLGIALFLAYRSQGTIEHSPRTKENISEGSVTQSVASIRRIFSSRSIVGLCFIQLTFATVLGVFSTLFSVYSKETLLFSPSLIGLLFSSRAIANLLIRLPMGKISDKAGRRKPLILGNTITMLVFFLIPETQNFLLLAFLMALYGLGHGARVAPSAALISESLNSEDRGLAFSIYMTMIDVGTVFGSLLAGFATSILPIPHIFRISALIILLGILVFSVTVKEP